MMKIILFIIALTLTQFSSAQQKYTCAVTALEYSGSKEVKKRTKRLDKEITQKLKKANPEFGSKYAALKTQAEKMDYVNYLINYEFNTADLNKPEDKYIFDFLKIFEFNIVSAKDKDRCFPAVEELRRQYNDTLHFYYSPIAKSGCKFSIYNVVNKEGIDKIGCVLKSIADRYKTGPIHASFYEKEIFEPTRTVGTDSVETTITVRGNEKMVEKLVIH